MNCTRSLLLFSLGMKQKESLTASMHGRMLSPLKRMISFHFLNLYLHTMFISVYYFRHTN
ncbi:hypothetical protein COI93_03570 [Bacillus cereus]|uniref:Uncharacterized protein n=1 Tax=Bacillus cereus TaxID=1396 RepID=A0A2B0N0D6_BACCE|nr:hypothetical protein COI93_03570 [Bacillus cereus]